MLSERTNMGMIRLSDEVEKRLKEIADGRSMSATVEMLMAGVGPDGKINTEPVLSASNRDYFDKKFDELKSLITDSLVDVVAAGGRAPGSYSLPASNYVDWPQMQYIIYTHEDDDPAWLLPTSAVFRFKEGDISDFAYSIKDNAIYFDRGNGGRPEPLIKITPEIQKAIDEKLTYD